MKPALAFWHTLTPGQQRLAQALIALSLISVFLAYVWLPAQRGRAELALRVPQLDAALARMKAQSAEVKAFNALPAVARSGSPRTAATAGSVQALFGRAANVSEPSPGQFQIRHAAIGYSTWLELLDQTLAKHTLRIDRLQLKALATAGQVEATLTLHTQTEGPKK